MFQMMGVFAEFERAMIQNESVLGLGGPRKKERSLVGPQ
jgi:DNA invertase Pin-like site-specific DNA recombinase